MTFRLAACALSMLVVSAVLTKAAPRAAQDQSGGAPATAGASASDAVLDQYCLGCHNERVPSAATASGVLFDRLDSGNVAAAPEIWEKVVRRLRMGTMPPDGARRPDEATMATNLRRSAELDSMTGALNRRTIDLGLARSFSEAHRNASPISVLFADLDHFKAINDTYGHACGDACLRHVSAVLRRELEPSDLMGRYGGEEFLLLLPGRDADAARRLGERVRAAVERAALDWNGAQIRLTVSIGVAPRLPDEHAPAAAVERADKALYAAKRAGRNQVCVAPARFI